MSATICDRITGEFSTQQLLAGLDPDARAAVDAITELRRIEAGEDVFCEGDAADGIYSVVSGSLSVLISTGGDRQRIATLGPGATFGEMAVLDGRPALDLGASRHGGHLQGAQLSRAIAMLEARFPAVRSVLCRRRW